MGAAGPAGRVPPGARRPRRADRQRQLLPRDPRRQVERRRSLLVSSVLRQPQTQDSASPRRQR